VEVSARYRSIHRCTQGQDRCSFLAIWLFFLSCRCKATARLRSAISVFIATTPGSHATRCNICRCSWQLALPAGGWDKTTRFDRTNSKPRKLLANAHCVASHHHTCMICLRKSRAVPVWLRRTLPEIGCTLHAVLGAFLECQLCLTGARLYGKLEKIMAQGPNLSN
jgi:hypothetical protein